MILDDAAATDNAADDGDDDYDDGWWWWMMVYDNDGVLMTRRVCSHVNIYLLTQTMSEIYLQLQFGTV